MNSPIPIVAVSSGSAADAPEGAVPFAAYGFDEPGIVEMAPTTGHYELHSIDGVATWVQHVG